MKNIAWVTLASAAIAAATSVRAGVVADYHDDFFYPAASVGWTYSWNKNGPIGNSANYVSLVPDVPGSGRWETENNTPDSFPDAAPGSSLSATATTLVPGQGTAQNAIERHVIAGYTISAADIATNGDQLILDLYSFAVPETSQDGITARVYKNDFLLIERPLPPGLVFTWETPAPNGGPIPLGPFAAGDTLYVAIGSDGIAPLPPVGVGGNDVGDVLEVDYSIVLVPEPASAAAILMAAWLLSGRRRRE